MSKKVFLAIATLAVMFLSLSLSSAYSYSNYYGGNSNSYFGDSYDSYSYISSRTTGSSWGPTTTKTTSYAKVRDRVQLPYGGYEDTVAYVKTTTKTPEYYVRYHDFDDYYNRDYGSRYGSGYRANSYNDYTPWYQKYWGNNNHDYYPRTYRYVW